MKEIIEDFYTNNSCVSNAQDMNEIGLFVADRISAMLAYWDENEVCRFANMAYVHWFGKSRAEMVGKMTLRELLGSSYELNLPFIKGVLKGEKQFFERDISTPSGEIWHSIATYYPDIHYGKVRGFFVHIANVSPIKKLELELKKNHDSLIKSSEIINEQNKRLINFSHIVAHNLRTYDNNMSTILRLLGEEEDEKERNILLEHLKSISKAFHDTLNNLNEIADVQTKQNISQQHINLNDYILKTLKLLNLHIKNSGAKIKNKVSEDIALYLNPAYMESILLNMFTKAIKYRHPDRKLDLEIGAAIDEDFLVLKIKDNGRGINLQKFGSKLFGMYQTFHGNSDAKGIGLFITKYQVDAMGGKIVVESEENIGTTFKIYFPLQ